MPVTYSIDSGADAAQFTINSTSGALAFKVAPDFEIPKDANTDNVYEVRVKATDAGGASTTQDIRVTVTDVNENSPPNFTSAPTISVAENSTAVITVVAVDPDGTSNPPITLTASGTITATANNQIIENKRVTGKIIVNGKTGVIIRNCEVRHPGGIGIDATSCTNLTVEDCKIINTSAATGQNPNVDEAKNMQLLNGGPYTVRRVYFEGAGGIYAYQTSGMLNLSFLEGHNIRGGGGEERGQLIQMNQCTGGVLMEDFSSENAPNNSWASDLVSLYQCSGSNIIRRGLLDGNNCPAGVMVMIENGTSGALIEDVDCIRHGNGSFAFYDASNNGIYRRCRMRDQILGNQGRGVPSSDGGAGPINIVAEPGTVTGARFEACKYFNTSGNLSWVNAGTFVDLLSQNFTARAPIRNVYNWQ